MNNTKLDTQSVKEQNNLAKIFTPTVIIVLIIADIVGGIIFGFLRNYQLKKSIATELSQVTDNEVWNYLFPPKKVRTRIISGTVDSIKILPNSEAIEEDFQHQLKWKQIRVYIIPDEDTGKEVYEKCNELYKDSDKNCIPIVFTPTTGVFEIDEYGNVNSDTISVGNKIKVYCRLSRPDYIEAFDLISNLRPETYTNFHNMLQKVTITEVIVDIYSVLLISFLITLLVYSIKNHTKELVDGMIFTLIFLFIGVVISTSIISTSVRECKEIVITDMVTNLCDIPFHLDYLAFEGVKDLPEVTSSEKTKGSDAIALFDAFPHESSDDFEYLFSSYGHPIFRNYRHHRNTIYSYIERYSPAAEKFYKNPDSDKWTSQYYASLHYFDTPQKALYEFDAFVDFYKSFTSHNESNKNIYYSDNEFIVYRKIEDYSVFDVDLCQLEYMRIDDNVLVYYHIVIEDTELEEIDAAKNFFSKVGIDVSKVDYAVEK